MNAANNEIPVPLIRVNQAGIVLLVVLGIVLQQPAVIAALWAIQVLSLWQGMRSNIIVILGAPLVKRKIPGAPTEARELNRFNQTIAVILLSLSVLLFWLLPGSFAGYIPAALVALAALLAICGFCVGCFLYFQFKRWRR